MQKNGAICVITRSICSINGESCDYWKQKALLPWTWRINCEGKYVQKILKELTISANLLRSCVVFL